MTFSSGIKNELSDLQWKDLCCVKAEIMAALLCSARFGSGKVSIATAHKKYMKRLSSMINEVYATDVKITHGSELYTIICEDAMAFNEILEDLYSSVGFDSVRGTVKEPMFTEKCCSRSFLRGVFLSCGSISEPEKAYHLELSTRRVSVASAIKEQLAEENINAGMLKRGGYHVLYIKEGQNISDFLLIIGAQKAMLRLESLMVDKSVRNSVNRIVNCDSANIDRIALTGARQLEAIKHISKNIGLNKLPEGLRKAAKLRLENPDISIKELGELMDPPLGKSGMNHRLKKLEQIASENK